MLNSIQLLRAIAALLVVFYHASWNLAKPKFFGDRAAPLAKVFAAGGISGVYLFFVLSGFIILLVHKQDLSRPARFATFWWKRFIRIFPTYWIVALSLCAAALFVPSIQSVLPKNFVDFLVGFFLLPDFDPDRPKILAVAWTLQYELIFYVLFGFCILNLRLAILFYVMCFAAFVFTQSSNATGLLGFIFNKLFTLFLMGILAALAFDRFVSLRFSLNSLLCGLGLFVVTLVLLPFFTHEFDGWIPLLLLGTGSAFLIFGVACSESLGAFPSISNIWIKLGNASFSIYLVHFPIISLGCKIAISLPVSHSIAWISVVMLTLVVVSVFCGLAFSAVVEFPIINILRRLRVRRSVLP